MTSHLTYSDPSDEDVSFARSQSPDYSSRRRSTRACDHCRRTKSKCERFGSPKQPCRGCTSLGLTCTYMGPSHKRGPPKGYIHAIERRLHQAEGLLGTIIGSHDPRAQSLLQDLSRDPLANQIIHRVESGPFGPKGRGDIPFGSTKQEFLASILEGAPEGAVSIAASKRQSRISREELTASLDGQTLVTPSSNWQDGLKDILKTNGSSGSSGSRAASQSPRERKSLSLHPPDSRTPIPEDDYLSQTQSPEAMASSRHPVDIDELSFDENLQIRWHGRATGLHLLRKCNPLQPRSSEPAPRVHLWPPVSIEVHRNPVQPANLRLPDSQTQDKLLHLYFDHLHPMFPILHRGHFIEFYTQRMEKAALPAENRPLSDVSADILLLTTFGLAARFAESTAVLSPGVLTHSSHDFITDALELLYTVLDTPHSCTCQALLLLGYYDLGVESGEKASFYIDAAISMAQRLGMNRSLEHLNFPGADVMSDIDEPMRHRIWLACSLLDKYASSFPGRPPMLRASDSDVSFDNDQPDDFVVTFTTSCGLASIIGSIMESLYSGRKWSKLKLHGEVNRLEDVLENWYLRLPPPLRYSPEGGASVPPFVLQLHVQYWSTVILLQRALVEPEYIVTGDTHSFRSDPVQSKALSSCLNAASRITSIMTAWDVQFSLTEASAFLPGYLLNAGIVFLVALRLRLWDPQQPGLQHCRLILEKVEGLWPTARTILALLDDASPDAPDPPRLRRASAPPHRSFPQRSMSISSDSASMQPRVFPVKSPSEQASMGQMLGLETMDVLTPSYQASTYAWWGGSEPIAQPLSWGGIVEVNGWSQN
ncbi:hypothetical protein JAAARDRAFT_35890 [Jaapia argillacea MUCL 33604]|uniref:Zn(2)-C6 fungal-type domain-containing protein n=1 Tax=Jaapia argillacea MUCL 33604 TaxID=933084 RepID=A0A067PR20_9AGAM|nr:hypothetical protein JAAARDRAFT_35890 [Jaapia argillacea MUCL 33604]